MIEIQSIANGYIIRRNLVDTIGNYPPDNADLLVATDILSCCEVIKDILTEELKEKSKNA